MASQNEIVVELAKIEAERRWNEVERRLEYSIGYAQAGLKGLFLANGASIISLLTFLGNSNSPVEPRTLWWAFVCFSVGITLTLGAYVAAYISQGVIMNAAFNQSRQADSDAYSTGQTYNAESHEKNGDLAANIALVLAICSLAVFIAGTFVALDAIT